MIANTFTGCALNVLLILNAVIKAVDLKNHNHLESQKNYLGY